MKKFTLAVHSLGNIGTRVVEAALAAPDCQCLGVIRRAESLGTQSHALRGLPEFADLAKLPRAAPTSSPCAGLRAASRKRRKLF